MCTHSTWPLSHRDVLVCVNTNLCGHLCFFTHPQPALYTLFSTDPSPFLGWSGLSESFLFPMRIHVKKKIKNSLRLSSAALLDARSRHTAASSTKSMADFCVPTQWMKKKKTTKKLMFYPLPYWVSVVPPPAYFEAEPFLRDGYPELKLLPYWLLQCLQPWRGSQGVHQLFVFPCLPPITSSWPVVVKGLVVPCIPCPQDAVSDFLAGSFALQHVIIVFAM